MNEDFLPITSNFVLLMDQEPQRRNCLEIDIINDDTAEPNEMFRVILQRDPSFTSPNINITVPSAIVVIVDDDRSKLKYNFHGLKLMASTPPLY